MIRCDVCEARIGGKSLNGGPFPSWNVASGEPSRIVNTCQRCARALRIAIACEALAWRLRERAAREGRRVGVSDG